LGPAFSWLLALRYLRSRWVNALAIVGVAVAVAALIFVRSMFTGFVSDIRTDVKNSAPDLLLTSLPHEQGFTALRDALVDEDAIEAMAPRLRHYGVFYQRRVKRTALTTDVDFNNITNSFVQLLGIDPELERKVTGLDRWIEDARERNLLHGAPELQSELRVPDEIEWLGRKQNGLPVPERESYRARWPGLLLGHERSRFLQSWLSIGLPLDVISVDYGSTGGPSEADVQSLQKTWCFAGAFHTGARLFDETTALVPIESLRTMLGHDIADDTSIDIVTDIALRVRAGLTAGELDSLRERIRRIAAATIGDGAAPEVLTWEEQNKVFLDAVEVERAMMTLVLFVVMLIAAFLIYAVLNMMVTQKVKDIGILTALGGTAGGVGGIFVCCGFVIGILGATLGAGLGVLALHYLNPVNDWLGQNVGFELFPRMMFDLPSIPYVLEPAWIAGIPTTAFLLTLLVAWLPARKAARMHPVQALSYE
jgi:ABC-type lipoprotein release transport system permease subunit